MKVALSKEIRLVRNSAGELVEVRRVRAVEDFTVAVFDGSDYSTVQIHQGQLGGYIQVATVTVGEDAWLNKDTIVLGNSTFAGVTHGYAKIEDSNIGRGTIITGGGAIIERSTVGENVSIFGKISIKGSKIKDGATIIGSTIVRNSDIGKNATLKAAGLLEHHPIGDGERYTSPLEQVSWAY